MQLDKITFLKDAQNIELVTKGYSGATKYMFDKEGKKYFLKIGQLKITINLEKLLSDNEILHSKIIETGQIDDTTNYIIEEYINGKDLKEEIDKYDSKFIYEFGFKLGEQYRKLRQKFPDKKMTEEKYKEYITKATERANLLSDLLYNNSNIEDDKKNLLSI